MREMGWMASWIAVEASKQAVFNALDVSEADEQVLPGSGACELSCAVLPNGWCLLFAEDISWACEARARALSSLGRTLACQFEDRVALTSVAFEMRSGAELWRVFHDNQQSRYRLDVTGSPPPALEEIKSRIFREQDEDGGEKSSTDFVHEVPLELAKSVCGYRHDDDDSHLVFRRLEGPGAPEGKPPRSRPSVLRSLLALFRGRASDGA
jgi:hypothetical protein